MQFTKEIFLLMITASVAQASVKPAILGHRGARALYPENTVEGIFRTIDAGIRIIELDVGLSKDGEIVVYHDPRVNPFICSSPTVPVTFFKRPRLMDLSLEELKSFDCGSRTLWWRFPRQRKIPGAAIPTLAELFEKVSEAYPNIRGELAFLVEAKVKISETPTAEEFAELLPPIIKNSAFDGRVTLQSFDIDFVRAMRDRAPEFETGLLWDQAWTPDPEQVKSMGARAFLPKFARTTKASVRKMQDAGLPVIVWTVNKKKDWEEAVNMGVDGIITDDPAGLKEYLGR